MTPGYSHAAVAVDLGRGPPRGHAALPIGAPRLTARLRVHLDIERRLERRDALVELAAVVDVLAVAEQRAFVALALDLTAALHLGLAVSLCIGLAIDLTVEVGIDFARALATRLAARLAVGHRRLDLAVPLAARAAAAFAARLAARLIRLRFAFARTTPTTVRFARSLTIELARVHVAIGVAARL